MTQTRGPTWWATIPLAAVALAALGAPVRAAVNVVPGQEFLYSGTAGWKVTATNGPLQTIAGPVKISALVTEADPAKGYAVVLMRSFQPEARAGQAKVIPEVDLGTVRYGADLAPSSTPDQATGPIGAVMQMLRLPLTPRADLKAGQEWRQSETLPAMPPRPTEIIYSVAGDSKVGDRSCTQIQKKLAQPLPLKQDLGRQSLELTEYSQTVCVDAETGQVLSNKLHEAAQVTAGEQKVNLDLTAAVTLQETRQLPAAELASRVKQAAAVERVGQSLRSLQPNPDGLKKALAATSKEVAAFHRDFPNSPYEPAVARLDELRGQIQAQNEKEGRLAGLKGAPAPDFVLKTVAGTEKTLAAYRGKIIVLNFFANW